jgi:hypothetical protein
MELVLQAALQFIPLARLQQAQLPEQVDEVRKGVGCHGSAGEIWEEETRARRNVGRWSMVMRGWDGCKKGKATPSALRGV